MSLPGVLNDAKTKRAIILPLSRGQLIQNVKFVNFDQADKATFGVAKIDVSIYEIMFVTIYVKMVAGLSLVRVGITLVAGSSFMKV
jgi:hypothetical protein